MTTENALRNAASGQIDTFHLAVTALATPARTGGCIKADRTYKQLIDAESWLRDEEIKIELKGWTPPATRTPEAQGLTVGEWVGQWLELRKHGGDKLKPSTLLDYENTLNRRLLEVEGQAAFLRDVRLATVTKKDILKWWDAINLQFDSPPYNRNAYARLKTALGAAVERELILANPCTIQAARTRVKPKRKELPEAEVMEAIIEHMSASNINPMAEQSLWQS